MPARNAAAGTRVLQAYLDAQRRHVLEILDGLDEAVLRSPMLPSGWSCVGLVQHLTVDVERFWFRAVVAGEPAAIDEVVAGPDDAWHVDPDLSVRSVLDAYREEIAHANAIIADASPTDPPAWWPDDLFGDFRLDDLGEILLHVIVETACHAGHLDVVRETIDGRLWLVVTG